jgi:hypothetical protein
MLTKSELSNSGFDQLSRTSDFGCLADAFQCLLLRKLTLGMDMPEAICDPKLTLEYKPF